MKLLIPMAIVAASLTACAKSSVTPISANQVMISTSAAPACGSAGAAQVASRMAAVATLRQGFDRYLIQDARSENNVQVFNRPATGVTVYGNSAHLTGGGTSVFGSNDTNLLVLMLRRGDPGFAQGIDAKRTLGADWATLVKNGIRTCTD